MSDYYAILFGAGASFGSDSSGTPPLGDTLFNALQSFDPNGWGTLSIDLKELFHDDFERGMHRLSELKPHNMPPLQRKMASYFFNFIPKPSNLYIALTSRIKQTNPKLNGSLASLNYDRLLEMSCIHVGLHSILQREINREDEIDLCLPHGCCNLFCKSVRGSAKGVVMSGTDILTRGPVTRINNPNSFNERILNDAFPPVMSYFEPLKRTLSGINFIEAQRKKWSVITSQATVIALIGIKVRPNEEHIWNPLSKTKARLVYCSGSKVAYEFESWADRVRPEGDLFIHKYFSESIDQICSEIGIF